MFCNIMDLIPLILLPVGSFGLLINVVFVNLVCGLQLFVDLWLLLGSLYCSSCF